MKSLLNWLAAAASLAGLFLTLRPPAGALSAFQVATLAAIGLVFGIAAFRDVRDELRRGAKIYKTQKKIDDYMYSLLRNSGRCEICSRDASWITDRRINELLQGKAKRGELTFLVHRITPELTELAKIGAEVIVYGSLGFDPVTRFTIANSGNQASSYVAIGRRKLNEFHTIEELDSSHPTYSMSADLIRLIRSVHAQLNKN